jgi:hypothetical protein
MSVMAWLGLPVVATLLAIVYAHWSNRPRGPEEALDSVERYQRFRQALAPGPSLPGRH